MNDDEKGVRPQLPKPQLPERSSRCFAQLGSDPFCDRLSAYLDQEVSDEDRRQIEEHCEQCESCRTTVSQFVSIGRLMRQTEPRVNTDAMWERVATQLDNADVLPTTTKSGISNWVYALFAIAASISLFWFVARNNTSTKQDANVAAHQHASLAVDFQDVFQLAKAQPKAAIARLVAKYQGQEVGQKAAINYLGYEPALFQNVPQGFTRVSTHVLNMPCCKCSATICERSDGTSVIVFEHKDEQPVWFGDSSSIETQCSGKTCKIVESAGQLAVSWKNQDRQLTVVGAIDLAEVNQWVASTQL